MPKFKNKKNGKVVKEYLLYYIEKFKNNPGYEEVIEKQSKSIKKNDEVIEEKPLQ